MADKLMRNPIRYCGVIPPMVTPLDRNGVLDTLGLEKLIEHILGGGVNGLFILGTTGEAPGLSDDIQTELIQQTCLQVNGRMPVLVGITNTCFERSLLLSKKAQKAGAAAVVLSTPYYFPLSQQDLIAYTKKVISQIDLPVFLYNIPSNTKVCFELQTLCELMDCPQIIGLKDSSGDMIYLQQARQLALEHRPDWSLLIGPEEMLAEAVLMGIHGGIPGGANLFPSLHVELYQAAIARRMDRLHYLQNLVLMISRSIYSIEKNGASYLKGLKCALACMGICGETPAQPVQCLPMHLKNQIRQKLEKDILPAMQELLPTAEAKRVILPVETENTMHAKNRVGLKH
jgi:4-hydroxy-tetrahydrodipicolinate synthase